MTLENNDPEGFLEQYGYLRKWIHECGVCHHKGYRPDTPLPSRASRHYTLHLLRRLFDELVLDENQMCEQCQSVQHSK